MERVREEAPRIHNITNYVTANDCANMLLACGAFPIMADDPLEAEEITENCSGLVLNLGTLSESRLTAMLLAGKRANALGHPVVLDPVGVAASSFRRRAAGQLLEEVSFACIRGNLSEIGYLVRGWGAASGVDVNREDYLTRDRLGELVPKLKELAGRLHTVVIATGEVDVVTDGNLAYCILNGHPAMGLVTGSGCQLSSLISAYASANREHLCEAAAAAVGLMGLCGEEAYEKIRECFGNVAYRNTIIDLVSRIQPRELEEGIRYEVW